MQPDGRNFRRFHAMGGRLMRDLPAALDERVVVDGHLITSRGAGTAQDFSFAIITALAGSAAAADVAAAIMA